MNPVLAALTARYPRVQWRLDDGGWYAGWHTGTVFVLCRNSSGGWNAEAQAAPFAALSRVKGAASAVEALEPLALRPEYSAALHAAPVEPVQVVEYVPPTAAELATAQVPQRVPFPAMLVAVVWRALWPLVVLGMALGCGALGMWWLTGGGQ